MNLIAKVILAGEGGVGKTTLVHRYLTNSFIDTTRITIGVAFYTHQIIRGEHKVLAQIWDLGGQEQFKQMGIFEKYFKGASVSVIMFDLTRKHTLESVQAWVNIALSESTTKLILVGGKKDLMNSGPDESLLEDLMEENNFLAYFETSSATGEGVEEVFNTVADIVIQSELGKENLSSI